MPKKNMFTNLPVKDKEDSDYEGTGEAGARRKKKKAKDAKEYKTNQGGPGHKKTNAALGG